MILLVDFGVGLILIACAFLLVTTGLAIAKELLKKDDKKP